MTRQNPLAKGDISEFFGFVRQCEQEKFINRVVIINLFEELFELSSSSQLETHFEIFREQISRYGLKDMNAAQGELLNIDFFCTRMCKYIMGRLSTSRDIEFKGKI
jgi:hypothetical protein